MRRQTPTTVGGGGARRARQRTRPGRPAATRQKASRGNRFVPADHRQRLRARSFRIGSGAALRVGREAGPGGRNRSRRSASVPRPPAPARGRRGRGGTTSSGGAQADMPSAEASGAICVQTLDDSRNSAIHITYRISLRPSSLREPRYPLLRVVAFLMDRGTSPRPPFDLRVFERVAWMGLVEVALRPGGSPRAQGEACGRSRAGLAREHASSPRRAHPRCRPARARRIGTGGGGAHLPMWPLGRSHQGGSRVGMTAVGPSHGRVSMILPQVHLRNGESLVRRRTSLSHTRPRACPTMS